MSRNAPLSVPDDDDDDALPDHLTNVLLRENSRQGVLLRPPNPVTLAPATPAPARPMVAIAPSIAGPPSAVTTARVVAPTIPIAAAVPRVQQQQVAVAPMPPVAPLAAQQPVQEHRPQPHQRQQQPQQQAQPSPQRQHHHHQQQQQQQQQQYQQQHHRQHQQHQQQQQLPQQPHQQAVVQQHQPHGFQHQVQQHQVRQPQAQQHQIQLQQAHVPQQGAQQQQNQQQQPQQQPQQQASNPSASRPRAKNDNSAQTAIWNCVYYNMQTYQQSILKDMHHIIARAQAEVDPRPDFGGSVAIHDRLRNAVKRMNANLIDQRNTDKKITYDTVVMSSLIQTQNNIIKEELRTLGINLSGLSPFLNLDLELRKRADAAYLAVKERVDRAKRAAASNGAATSPALKAAAGARTVKEEGVYNVVHTYQQSILADVHHIIARAQVQVDPHTNTGGSHSIQERLKNAIKRMNVRLEDQRSRDKKITFDTTLISSLILIQNNIIKEELRTLGINLASLSPLLNIDLELKKRADASYLTVKERVDRAKRAIAAANGKATPPTSNGAVGSRTAKKEKVKPEAAAPAQAPAPPVASIASAAATANPMLTATVAAQVQANHFQPQSHLVAQQQPATPILHAPAPPIPPIRQASAPAPGMPPPAPAPGSVPILPDAAPRATTPLAPAPAYTAAPAGAPVVAAVTAAAQPVRGVKAPAHAHAHAHAAAAVAQGTPATTPGYGATPAAHAQAPEYTRPTPTASASTATARAAPVVPAAAAAAAGGPAAPTASRPAPTPRQSYERPKVHLDEDKRGLQRLPSDNLETVKRKVESVPGLDALSAEEQLLRNAPALAAAEEQMSKPWFVTNVVNHRHAWCCLRDAAGRAGMRKVLKERPWANPEDHSEGANQAVGSDVLQLMSLSTQFYLKDLMKSLRAIAWQRKGGVSADLLEEVESRLENFTDDTNSCEQELRRGLVPKLPPVREMPRVLLKKEEECHRNECQKREERWEAELKNKLKAAEELRKRLIRRGQRKLPTGGYKWWEDMEATVKSGWLSREQLATSEFARRVAVKHGIGVVASFLKRKEEQANKDQSHRGGGASGGVTTSPNLDPEAAGASHFPDVSMEDVEAATSSVGEKRPLDPLQDKTPIDTVRNIRRRLTLGPASDTSSPGGMGGGPESPKERPAAGKVEISNTHLAELLRSTKPRGDRHGWARILYLAQSGLKGVHAAGGRVGALR